MKQEVSVICQGVLYMCMKGKKSAVCVLNILLSFEAEKIVKGKESFLNCC